MLETLEPATVHPVPVIAEPTFTDEVSIALLPIQTLAYLMFSFSTTLTPDADLETKLPHLE